jgi:hypothetical protein
VTPLYLKRIEQKQCVEIKGLAKIIDEKPLQF